MPRTAAEARMTTMTSPAISAGEAVKRAPNQRPTAPTIRALTIAQKVRLGDISEDHDLDSARRKQNGFEPGVPSGEYTKPWDGRLETAREDIADGPDDG